MSKHKISSASVSSAKPAFPAVSYTLPKGWRRELLDAITQRASGHTPDQSKPNYWNGGIKWVSLADSAKLDKGYIYDTEKQISLLGIKNSSARLLEPNTVIVSRDAGVGKSALLKEEMAVSQHFIAWSCREKNELDPWFLYAWLQRQKSFFERMAVGSTIKTIGLPLFKKLTIDFPPLKEQKKISSILLTWDEGIEKLRALRALKKRRLNGVASKLIYADQHPQSTLREYIKEISIRNSDEKIQRVLSVTNANGFVKSEEQFAHRVASTDLSAYKVICRGQYAYNPSRINVGSIARLKQWDDGALSPMYVVFEVAKHLDSDFFGHWLNSSEAKSRIRLAAQGSVRDTVSFTDLGTIKIPIPSFERQIAISQALNAAQKEIQLIEKEIFVLADQKRGLMQKLLTGTWRVRGAT